MPKVVITAQIEDPDKWEKGFRPTVRFSGAKP